MLWSQWFSDTDPGSFISMISIGFRLWYPSSMRKAEPISPESSVKPGDGFNLTASSRNMRPEICYSAWRKRASLNSRLV
jgi:hypothetical protein